MVDAAGGWIAWAAVVVAAAFVASPWGARGMGLVQRPMERIARRPGLAMAMVAGLSFLLSAVTTLLSLQRAPLPSVHDEFSYLLAGETFARGRLTNPPHPMAEHLETIHVLQRPTYASKYPPGQGLALALGILLSGEAIVGVWIAIALACAAVCWALHGWVSQTWALIGGLLCAVHPTVVGWSFSYWGGGMAMLGGALLIGAAGRLMARPAASMGAILGIGIGILAITRPYEGILVVLPILIALGMRSVQRPIALKSAGAALAVLACFVAWMGWYNYRVTGDPLQLPYTLHDRQYNYTPHLVFQSLRKPPEYRHPALREFHAGIEEAQWRKQQTPAGWAQEAGTKLAAWTRGMARPLAMVLPLIMLPQAIRKDRRLRMILAAMATFAAGLSIVTWSFWPHYAAPLIPLWVVLIMTCMTALSADDAAWIRRWGPPIVRVLCLLILFAAFQQIASSLNAQQQTWQLARQHYIDALVNDPGPDLVLVRYLPGHDVHQEWVYNAADIDGSEIVWARDSGEARSALSDYFKDRKKWIIEIDDRQAKLLPYR